MKVQRSDFLVSLTMGFSPCTRRYHASVVAVLLPVTNLATDIDESCSPWYMVLKYLWLRTRNMTTHSMYTHCMEMSKHMLTYKIPYEQCTMKAGWPLVAWGRG